MSSNENNLIEELMRNMNSNQEKPRSKKMPVKKKSLNSPLSENINNHNDEEELLFQKTLTDYKKNKQKSKK